MKITECGKVLTEKDLNPSLHIEKKKVAQSKAAVKKSQDRGLKHLSADTVEAEKLISLTSDDSVSDNEPLVNHIKTGFTTAVCNLRFSIIT